ncbi:MAG TPA: substrate-binding domain-containing protein [Pseudolabrys sp.]|jgi:molybdate transport system substrate-binding protein|nr:substrate-binding domain-containing protein [Pseudolabrys sp.]
MADLKILSTHAIEDVLHELGPAFERASGASLAIDYDPANALKRRIEEGTAFDIAIVTRPVIDALSRQGKIRPETCTDIGRSGLGVAVRKGEPPPDVSTVDAFKNALLAVRSVARSKEGTSGLYFETLLIRLGIAEAMRAKIVLGGSGRIAELVVSGQADLAVQQIPELLPVTGADFAGPLPDELQLYTVFSAGIGAACKARDTAIAFIDSLTTPAAAAVFKTKGLESVPR